MDQELHSRPQWIRIKESFPASWLRGWTVVMLLLVWGWLIHSAEEHLWQQVQAREPELKLNQTEGALGSGAIFALVGGFRSVMANFTWLQANMQWMEREPAATQALIELSVTLDPRPHVFWQDGARMLALDMPLWEVRQLEKIQGPLPEVARQQIFARYAALGLNLLDEGLRYHPNDPALLLDKAHICMVRLDDPIAAAEYYRQAAETPTPPPYAARIYASLLEKQGKQQTAINYLENYLSHLPAEDTLTQELVKSKLEALRDSQ